MGGDRPLFQICEGCLGPGNRSKSSPLPPEVVFLLTVSSIKLSPPKVVSINWLEQQNCHLGNNHQNNGVLRVDSVKWLSLPTQGVMSSYCPKICRRNLVQRFSWGSKSTSRVILSLLTWVDHVNLFNYQSVNGHEPINSQTNCISMFIMVLLITGWPTIF